MKKSFSTSSKLRGFTLIELLVVIAIIGLLSTLAVVALNSAREKARDAKRVADVKQLQTALELYFNDNSGYPPDTGFDNIIILGSSGGSYVCLGGTAGFQNAGCSVDNTPIYMGLVPSNPKPNGVDYIYEAWDGGGGHCASGSCPEYTIEFSLEGRTGGLASGAVTASQDGITQ